MKQQWSKVKIVCRPTKLQIFLHTHNKRNMKAKIIIAGLIEEKLVATFNCFADANIAAVMLQACTTNESNLLYYVEYKGTRRLAGSLAQHLPYINAGEKNNCKSYFNS